MINHEKGLVNNDNKNVFLAGFSQGGMMAYHMQLGKLDFALGGVMALSTTPAPPVTDMIGQSKSVARSLASYAGADMRWMVYHGAADFYFDRNITLNVVNDVFRAMDIE